MGVCFSRTKRPFVGVSLEIGGYRTLGCASRFPSRSFASCVCYRFWSPFLIGSELQINRKTRDVQKPIKTQILFSTCPREHLSTGCNSLGKVMEKLGLGFGLRPGDLLIE